MLILNLNLLAQEISITRDKIQNEFTFSKSIIPDTNFYDIDNLFSSFVFREYNNDIYCLNKLGYKEDNYIYYNLLNLNDNKITKLIIDKYDSTDDFSFAKDFVFLSKDTIIVGSFKSIIFFKLKDNDYYVFNVFRFNKQNLDAALQKLHIYNNYIYTYANDFYTKIGENMGKNRDSVYSFYTKIDLKTLSIVDYKIIEMENTSVFSVFQPRSLIDGLNNKILKINSFGPNIEFSVVYLNTGEIRKYNYKPTTWVGANKKVMINVKKLLKSSVRDYMKNVIDSLRPFLQKYSFVANINFINDSTLFILRTSPKKNFKYIYDLKVYIDIIKFNVNGITKVIELDQDEFYKEKQNENKPLHQIVNRSWIIPDNCYFSGQFLIIKENIPIKIDDNFYKKYSYSDIKMISEDFLLKNNYFPLQFVILAMSGKYE